MKSEAIYTTLEKIDDVLSGISDTSYDIILLFSSLKLIEDTLLVTKIKQKLPTTRLMGCSTSGEFGSGFGDDTISLLGLKFEKTKFECTAVALTNASDSRKAGRQIAEKLLRPDLRGIFVLSPGLNVNGSEITEGLKEVLPRDVFVSGGLAGDGTNFKKTCVVLDEGVSDKQAVAFGLYGDNIQIRSGSSGGWKPFGPLRRVTKAEKNILFELDGKPALALYKEYLGDKVKQLPASGLLYPFAIMNENKEGQKGLIRTILGIDEANNSLILAGNMDIGSVVSLMHASTDELVDGARSAATKALTENFSTSDSAAICVSCVGRRIAMGEDTEEELEAIREEFHDMPMAGFYSYGEICHHEDTDQPELHNQTMTITYITENAA